ncbi:unnamed protein product [Allacma fusca]|uniref:Uncharacterized protein n=1 Tax=Allacma fusca TaxID=39272 RepID=A0A8J2LUE3_9HEXA|nr:unnamed protein product [Allacma fusca]
MDQVLRPLLEDGIAQLYGEDSTKVFVHDNAARSDTPSKSPDVSPRDFFCFGFLTQTLQRTKDYDERAVEKLREVWNDGTPGKCVENIGSRKRRLRTISKKDRKC